MAGGGDTAAMECKLVHLIGHSLTTTDITSSSPHSHILTTKHHLSSSPHPPTSSMVTYSPPQTSLIHLHSYIPSKFTTHTCTPSPTHTTTHIHTHTLSTTSVKLSSSPYAKHHHHTCTHTLTITHTHSTTSVSLPLHLPLSGEHQVRKLHPAIHHSEATVHRHSHQGKERQPLP